MDNVIMPGIPLDSKILGIPLDCGVQNRILGYMYMPIILRGKRKTILAYCSPDG